MPLVTGMGCTLGAVIAAFRGISNNSFDSANIATCYFGLCGQAAEHKAKTPGTFRTAFIDALNEADFSMIDTMFKSTAAL
jgi:hydroxyethylthiazole kinase